MPKIINHDERKQQIAQAMWRVILDKGMEGATVRNIAEEAGLSLGALRHYFSTQDDLLVYAMTLVTERATARIEAVVKRNLPPREMVLAVLYEIVPLNEETRAEMQVWFAFVAYVHHRKNELPIPDDGIREGIQKLIYYLNQLSLLKPGLNLELEVERLYSLIDGIAIHALLEPERLDAEKVRRTIHYHIDSICIRA
ncbi:TetR/AcrR family transcriptional regulator [Sporosarcina sp. Te-1]|uniref:TetR/AcrR family transcriptional regulator n=1 Tax=Sporosarcina sp. Te-1 TaxID=2818390 RepID=UPI001A9E0B62|nr:TetR family transcriptional regulator C-terminal domain-containing protein [Sporosarcina sp. Te-1]QTD39901.1 TetR family transcriptional regulator C-terminal domain-containing protein [Sporosarcina sp. Te-1]